MAVFLMMFDVEFVNGREEGVPKPNMHYSPFGVVPPLRPVLARMSGGGRVIEGVVELWTMGLVDLYLAYGHVDQERNSEDKSGTYYHRTFRIGYQ
jgi:hypothetical protein